MIYNRYHLVGRKALNYKLDGLSSLKYKIDNIKKDILYVKVCIYIFDIILY